MRSNVEYFVIRLNIRPSIMLPWRILIYSFSVRAAEMLLPYVIAHCRDRTCIYPVGLNERVPMDVSQLPCLTGLSLSTR